MRVQAIKNNTTADVYARFYPDYLLKVGEGKIPTTEGSNINPSKFYQFESKQL